MAGYPNRPVLSGEHRMAVVTGSLLEASLTRSGNEDKARVDLRYRDPPERVRRRRPMVEPLGEHRHAPPLAVETSYVSEGCARQRRALGSGQLVAESSLFLSSEQSRERVLPERRDQGVSYQDDADEQRKAAPETTRWSRQA
jgi:hypothetical protein